MRGSGEWFRGDFHKGDSAQIIHKHSSQEGSQSYERI